MEQLKEIPLWEENPVLFCRGSYGVGTVTQSKLVHAGDLRICSQLHGLLLANQKPDTMRSAFLGLKITLLLSDLIYICNSA